jgi:hypothetical protein
MPVWTYIYPISPLADSQSTVDIVRRAFQDMIVFASILSLSMGIPVIAALMIDRLSWQDCLPDATIGSRA